jgi:hypothetical protein
MPPPLLAAPPAKDSHLQGLKGYAGLATNGAKERSERVSANLFSFM